MFAEKSNVHCNALNDRGIRFRFGAQAKRAHRANFSGKKGHEGRLFGARETF